MTVSAENSMSQWTMLNTTLHPNNTDQSGARDDNDGVLIDDFAKKIFILVNHVIVDMCICIFGIVGNCLNITVFLKQGLHKSVNLSLFAMSISDLTGLSFQVWHNFCLNPYLELANLPFDFLEIQMLTAGRPSILMVRVTGWITMYITAERCLSVVLPLKIREIITFRRTAINLLLMFGINLAFYLPVTSSDYVTWKFYPSLNKTQLGLAFRGNKPAVEWLINTSHFYLSLFAFIFVIIFTAVLVISLRRKSKWRRGATSGTDQREARTSRENKTIALVIMVAIVLIVCYAPGVCCAITEALYPEFRIVAKQSNFYQVIWSFNFIFHSINASINVVVYYKMSSKYRATMNEIVPCFKNRNKGDNN
ncbi:G-protein coupled receptor [Biomphalaria glabrata]|uniref:Neuropeptides capa receptor-like n=1 Tax=Biomphalaria glabrata TaxID=6526 RepID=A0A9U8EJY0_BIOGL|nr:neuropeptides capa receptor-like [Biomphalaria glabrata]KAI8731529.1 putative G-protein coupled receptor [Biomphalaria glabrata]